MMVMVMMMMVVVVEMIGELLEVVVHGQRYHWRRERFDHGFGEMKSRNRNQEC